MDAIEQQTGKRDAVPRRFARLRHSERVLLAYLAYTSMVGVLLGVRYGSRAELVAVNAAIWIMFLLFLTRLRLSDPWRDWLPYPLTLLCYREAGWVSSAFEAHGLEQRWIAWDRMVLDVGHARAVIESLGALIPTVLEIAYVSVYVTGLVAVGVLYYLRARAQVDRLWTAYLLGLMLAYAMFPFWPSEPPRVVFPGMDLPAIMTAVRRLNLFLVGNYGIHSSVFPSAHVSGAVAVGLMMRRILPGQKWLGNVLLAVAVLIGLGAFYGRYHYLADVLAGAAIGILGYRLSIRLYSSQR